MTKLQTQIEHTQGCIVYGESFLITLWHVDGARIDFDRILGGTLCQSLAQEKNE